MSESSRATKIRACHQTTLSAPFEVAPQSITVRTATIQGQDGEIEMLVLSDFADRSDGAARVLMRFGVFGSRHRGVVTVTSPRPAPRQYQALAEACATYAARAAGGSVVALAEILAAPAG